LNRHVKADGTVVLEKDLEIPSSKVGIEEIRLRLFRQAGVSQEVTAICRALSLSEEDPIVIGLLRDDVPSFQTLLETRGREDIPVSQFLVEPRVAAALCRARSISDHLQRESGSEVNVSAAKATILNGDLLLFRRVSQRASVVDYAQMFAFAAGIGRYAFISEELLCESPISSDHAGGELSSNARSVVEALGPRWRWLSVWLRDNCSPACNVRNVTMRMKSELLVLDEADLGHDGTVDSSIIDRCLGPRSANCIEHICVFDRLRTWTRHDGSTARWLQCSPIWPEVRIVDFSRCQVSSIGEASFINSSKLIEVILPDTLVELGRGSFYECGSLKVVKFGKGVKTLGDDAFSNCRSLIEIVLPDTVMEVGKSAFYGCRSLRAVIVGKGLGTLGERALCQCGSLIEIVLPDAVKEVGDGAFSLCYRL
jgi:hypothetical protein